MKRPVQSAFVRCSRIGVGENIFCTDNCGQLIQIHFGLLGDVRVSWNPSCILCPQVWNRSPVAARSLSWTSLALQTHQSRRSGTLGATTCWHTC